MAGDVEIISVVVNMEAPKGAELDLKLQNQIGLRGTARV